MSTITAPPVRPQSKFLQVVPASEYAGVSPDTIRFMIAEGVLKAKKVTTHSQASRGRWMIARTELDRVFGVGE